MVILIIKMRRFHGRLFFIMWTLWLENGLYINWDETQVSSRTTVAMQILRHVYHLRRIYRLINTLYTRFQVLRVDVIMFSAFAGRIYVSGLLRWYSGNHKMTVGACEVSPRDMWKLVRMCALKLIKLQTHGPLVGNAVCIRELGHFSGW